MFKLSTAQLWVHDQDEALAFYTSKLGFEVRSDVTMPEMGGFRWLTVGPPGQPEIAHGGKMRSARDEVNVGAALDQPGTEIPADAARPHDRNSHRALRAQAGDQYCGNAIGSMH